MHPPPRHPVLPHHALRAWALSVFGLAASAVAAPEPARKSDDFVEFMGVNVHPYTIYAKNHDRVVAKLGELGVRHVRDGAVPPAYRFAHRFWEQHGIRTTFISGRREPGEPHWKAPLAPEKVVEELRELRERALPAIAAIEGPNEYDLYHDERENAWVEKLRSYQEALHTAVKADPALAHLPVIGPSLISPEAYRKVGDLSAFLDASCLHPYGSTRNPGSNGWGPGGYGSIPFSLRNAALQNPPSPDGTRKPVWATEFGYHNLVGKAAGIPEEVEARYLPRSFAEHFRNGFQRVFEYELLDQNSAHPTSDQMHFGLLRSDFSEKPAFTALKNLIALLRDSQWDPASKTWSPVAFQPGTLDFELAGDTRHVRHVLLQKQDGRFLLLLWQEVEGYETPAGHPEITPAYRRDAAVTATVATPVAGEVVVRTQGRDGNFAEARAALADGALALEVPDRLMLVELVPAER